MDFQRLELPPAADFHVHLRDGAMMELVAPMVRKGGVDTAYVMPNLQPPITTVEAAQAYHERLKAVAPDVEFLMTLYLHPSITPSIVAAAARSGVIAGIKSYPSGVTTNSDDGVLDYEQYYPVFAAMQEHNLVLNLHGEVPSTPLEAATADAAVTVLNAESKFLPTLRKLHADFPKLRIVLEHCTTREALDAVRACGPTVAGTITAHHLWLVVDDWAGDAFCYCKPVAKGAADRAALLRAAAEGNPKFFFGSDSAPHPVTAKRGGQDGRQKAAAGVFTQPHAISLVVAALEQGVKSGVVGAQTVTQASLEGFLGGYGREFYKGRATAAAPSRGGKIVLERKRETVPRSYVGADRSVEVVPFRSGMEVHSVSWGAG